MSTDDRLDRLAVSVESLAGLVTLNEQTQRGFQTLTALMTRHEARLASLEGQMTEVLGRLRIIGEQLAAHMHNGAEE
ncbi:MAG: hypothetical protein ACRDY7_07300 [Acidimicrobiia bacterium]